MPSAPLRDSTRARPSVLRRLEPRLKQETELSVPVGDYTHLLSIGGAADSLPSATGHSTHRSFVSRDRSRSRDFWWTRGEGARPSVGPLGTSRPPMSPSYRVTTGSDSAEKRCRFWCLRPVCLSVPRGRVVDVREGDTCKSSRCERPESKPSLTRHLSSKVAFLLHTLKRRWHRLPRRSEGDPGFSDRQSQSRSYPRRGVVQLGLERVRSETFGGRWVVEVSRQGP